MKCKLYKWLYHAVPLVLWQSFLMKLHLSSCPVCRDIFSPDGNFDMSGRTLGIRSSQVNITEDLWKQVESKLPLVRRDKKNNKLFLMESSAWKWATGSALGILLLLLHLFLPLPFSSPPPDNSTEVVVQNRNIVIHSIKVDNRSAQSVYIQSGNEDRLIVWVK